MTAITRRQHKKEIQLLEQIEPPMHQPLQTYKGGGGVYLQNGNKKIRLSGNRHQTISAAGRVYWKQILGEKPPMLYDYNQPLIQDKFIRTRTGKRLQVRRRAADGTFTVLPAGAAYFRHHRSLWIPLIPRLIVNKPKGGQYTARKSKNGVEYVSLASMPLLTAATLRERTGGQDGVDIVATDEEQ